MKKIIRLTESELHELVKEAVNRILSEDGATAAGGGALGGSNLMVGSSDESGGVAYPAFAKKNKKKVGGNAFSEPIMRQKHNLGDVTNAPTNQVDMKPALERGGSISMNRIGGKKKVTEEVDEGWLKNAAMAGAMGAATMFGNPQTANAQGVQQQQNKPDSVQTDSTKTYNNLGDVLRSKGASEQEIQSLGRQMNPANLMMRNSRGEGNTQINQFLSTIKNASSSMSTKNIKIFGANEYDAQSKYLSQFDANTAKNFKLFMLRSGGTVLMPINYTIQNVQQELQPSNAFQLGNFDIK